MRWLTNLWHDSCGPVLGVQGIARRTREIDAVAYQELQMTCISTSLDRPRTPQTPRCDNNTRQTTSVPLLHPARANLGQQPGGQAVAQLHLSRPRLSLDGFQKPRGLQDLIHHPGKRRAMVFTNTGAHLAKGRRPLVFSLRPALLLGDLPAAPPGSVQLAPDLGTDQ